MDFTAVMLDCVLHYRVMNDIESVLWLHVHVSEWLLVSSQVFCMIMHCPPVKSWSTFAPSQFFCWTIKLIRAVTYYDHFFLPWSLNLLPHMHCSHAIIILSNSDVYLATAFSLLKRIPRHAYNVIATVDTSVREPCYCMALETLETNY